VIVDGDKVEVVLLVKNGTTIRPIVFG